MPEAHVVIVAGPRAFTGLGVVDARDHLFLDPPAPAGALLDPQPAGVAA